MAKDYYQILGVDKNVSSDDLKKAFRRLAHEHHPDKGGDAQKFKDINEAYQILGDAEKRAQYDQFGSAAFEQGGMGGAGGFGGGFNGFGGFDVNMGDMGDLGDVLGGMFGFGGGGSRTKTKRGQDIEVDVTLDFFDTVKGVDKTIKLYKHDVCQRCQGNGGEPGSKSVGCKTCNSSGRIERAQRTIFGTVQMATVCPDCQGTGSIPEKRCNECSGVGVKRREKELTVQIPAGVSDGEALKLEGEGEHPGRGGRPGDAFIRLRVKKHPTFTREGNDVLSTVQIPYSTLTLGDAVDIETVDGPGSLKIPEGTQAGTVFKLRAKGIPFFRSHGRGDHYVTVQPIVKDHLTKEQKRLLEDLRKTGL